MNLAEIFESLPSHHWWMKSTGSPWNAKIRASEVQRWWITLEPDIPSHLLESNEVGFYGRGTMFVHPNLTTMVHSIRGRSCKICCALYCDGEVFAAINADYSGEKITELDIYLIPEFNVGLIERELSHETVDLLTLLNA